MLGKLIRFIIMTTGILTLSFFAFSYYHLRQTLPIPKAVTEKTIIELDFSKDFTEDESSSLFSARIGSSPHSLYKMVKIIEQAAEDQRISGIIVHLGRSIDLGMAQIQELRNAIKDFRNHGKYAHLYTEEFISNTTGTRLYYLASAFDHITVQSMGEVGVVGFALESPFLKDFFDKQKIIPAFEKVGDYKGFTEVFSENDFSSYSKEQMMHLLKNLHHQVVAAISQERKLSLEQVEQIITNGPYTPFEAKEKNLIDAIGFYDDAKDYIQKKAGENSKIIHQWEYTYDPLSLKKVILPTHFKKKPVKIALVYALGGIRESTEQSLNSRKITSRKFDKIFNHILQDSGVRAVVLRIDSGGGAAIVSQTIAHKIKLLQQKGIPVIVSMGNYAASGAYLMAAGAQRIFAQPATITGSIGVFGGKFVTNPAWEAQGINWRLLKTADNADMWHTTTDFSPFAKERLKSLTQNIYKVFVEEVAKGRKLSVETVEKYAQGRVWTGQQALENHLVDALGGLTEAIQYAKELITDVPSFSITVENFPKPQTFMGHLFQLIGLAEEEEDTGMGLSGHIAQEIKVSVTQWVKELSNQHASLRLFSQF